MATDLGTWATADLGWIALLREVWRLSWPAIVRNSLNCASDRVTLAFVGQWDKNRDHYDAASLGKMVSTFCSQYTAPSLTCAYS